MATGPGKYDHLATEARLGARARGVVLLVIDGRLGSGFSVQGDPALNAKLPTLLRTLAGQIEADLEPTG